jgi:hypothetical protein
MRARINWTHERQGTAAGAEARRRRRIPGGARAQRIADVKSAMHLRPVMRARAHRLDARAPGHFRPPGGEGTPASTQKS